MGVKPFVVNPYGTITTDCGHLSEADNRVWILPKVLNPLSLVETMQFPLDKLGGDPQARRIPGLHEGACSAGGLICFSALRAGHARPLRRTLVWARHASPSRCMLSAAGEEISRVGKDTTQ